MKFPLIWLILIISCQSLLINGEYIRFKLSARNLPGKTDPFVEVRTLKEKTETRDREQNPDWSKMFTFHTDSYEAIEFEVRDDEDAGLDKSLGWARIISTNFKEKRTFHAGLWTDDEIYMGTLRVTVTDIW